MDEKKVKKETKKLTLAEMQFILLTDILLRSPVWGVVVALVFGGAAYFFVWLALHVLIPWAEK